MEAPLTNFKYSRADIKDALALSLLAECSFRATELIITSAGRTQRIRFAHKTL